MDTIEADTSDAGSTYSKALTDTTSLRSSIYTYEVEHGRTYHAFHAGKYNLPNDDGEKNRMDLHYHAARLTIGDVPFLAPLPKTPAAILDVGTGTGIWCMDVADLYPDTAVTGFDLSPIQPSWVPSNCSFEIADADEDWSFGSNKFDLVHTRFMNGFSIKSWPHCYREAFAALQPGGWVECQEFDFKYTCDDDSIPTDSKFKHWAELWVEGIEKLGASARCYPEVMAQQMRDAGFVNVEIKNFGMPATPWAKKMELKQVGLYQYLAVTEGLQGLSVRVFTKGLGWKMEDVEVLLEEVRVELRNPRIHGYWPTYVILGQKPEVVAT